MIYNFNNSTLEEEVLFKQPFFNSLLDRILVKVLN